MQRTVELLREGWYGTGNKYSADNPLSKKPVNCKKLWKKCCEIAGTKFIPRTDGLAGTIGSLLIDETYEIETSYIPIDTLVSQLTEEGEGDGFMQAVGGGGELLGVEHARI